MAEVTRYRGEAVEMLTRREDGRRIVRGVASVYYDGTPRTEYALADDIIERIAPGAFDGLLEGDTIACTDHDPAKLLGRNGKTLKLWTTSRGLEYEVSLIDTTACNDLWANVEAGNIRGSSFKAALNYGDSSAVQWSKEGKTNVCTIKRFDVLADVAPCVNPAYGATSVAVRSALERHEETLRRLARNNDIQATYKTDTPSRKATR